MGGLSVRPDKRPHFVAFYRDIPCGFLVDHEMALAGKDWIMAKFMLILHKTPGIWRQLSPEEMQRKVEKYQAWMDKIHSSGRHVSSEKLGEETIRGPGWCAKPATKRSIGFAARPHCAARNTNWSSG